MWYLYYEMEEMEFNFLPAVNIFFLGRGGHGLFWLTSFSRFLQSAAACLLNNMSDLRRL